MNPCTVILGANLRVRIEATRVDTATWAARPGRSWPCSTLAGYAVSALLEPNGDLIDLVCGAGENVDGAELTAFCDDMLDLAARVLLDRRSAQAKRPVPCPSCQRAIGPNRTDPCPHCGAA